MGICLPGFSCASTTAREGDRLPIRALPAGAPIRIVPNEEAALRASLVEVLPLKMTRQFHRVRIAGQVFVGVLIGRGPYIFKESRRWPGESYLGPVSTVALLQEDAHPLGGGPPGWYICKYMDQPHVYLEDMDEDCRKALMAEFGLGLAWSVAVDPFVSPAFAGLAAWAKRHPRLAEADSTSAAYLPGWLDRLRELYGLRP